MLHAWEWRSMLELSWELCFRRPSLCHILRHRNRRCRLLAFPRLFLLHLFSFPRLLVFNLPMSCPVVVITMCMKVRQDLDTNNWCNSPHFWCSLARLAIKMMKILYTALHFPSLIFTLQRPEKDWPSLDFTLSSVLLHNPFNVKFNSPNFELTLWPDCEKGEIKRGRNFSSIQFVLLCPFIISNKNKP